VCARRPRRRPRVAIAVLAAIGVAVASTGAATTIPDFGTVVGFKLTGDGQHVVFEIERQSDGTRDLYSIGREEET
jgi:hypothetical protein